MILSMISVDISNVWGSMTLPELLAMEREIAAAHQTLYEGSGAGSDYLGWMDLPVSEPTAELTRLLKAAQRIRENSDVLVVIGIGGGCMGAEAVIELLQGPNRNMGRRKGDPLVLFAGNNLSTRSFNDLCRNLEGRDYSLCVVSKSGATLESAVALRNLKWMMERKYGTDGARKRIYAVTSKTKGSLRQMANEELWESFVLSEDVSSRFSVLSPAGLLPMAVAGIDILELLQGAVEAREEYNLRSFENPAWLYVGVRNALYRKGKKIELMTAFEPSFRKMGAWWQQLMAQSEGKQGKGIFPACAQLTGDLYTLGQMVQEGERNLFETMLRFESPEESVIIGDDVKDLDNLNYLAGKSLSWVEEMTCMGIVQTHVDGSVPVLSMELGTPDARQAGELLWFFQLCCGISGYVLGVNPFSQPGVALCKQNVFRLLGRPGSEN